MKLVILALCHLFAASPSQATGALAVNAPSEIFPALRKEGGPVALKEGSSTFTGPRFEARIKVTPGPADEKAAKRVAELELQSVRGLYQPTATPYAGEVSKLLVCQRELTPRDFEFTVGGAKVRGIVGGVSSRFAFGACVPEQVAYLGAFFVLRDGRSGRLVEVRIFDKSKAKTKNIASASDELIKVAGGLLVEGAASP